MATIRVNTLLVETRPHVQTCDHPMENEVEYIPENQVEKEPNYQHGGNDMQLKTSLVSPAQSLEYVTMEPHEVP